MAQPVTRAAASNSGSSSSIPSKRRGVDQMKDDVGEGEEDGVQVKADQSDDEEAAKKAAEQQAMRLAALAVLDEVWDDDVGKVQHGSEDLKRIITHRMLLS